MSAVYQCGKKGKTAVMRSSGLVFLRALVVFLRVCTARTSCVVPRVYPLRNIPDTQDPYGPADGPSYTVLKRRWRGGREEMTVPVFRA